MSYDYQKERPKIFTEDGQSEFLKVRDHVNECLKNSGAVMMARAISVVSGDCWKQMAYVDRMVELGELQEVSGKNMWPEVLELKDACKKQAENARVDKYDELAFKERKEAREITLEASTERYNENLAMCREWLEKAWKELPGLAAEVARLERQRKETIKQIDGLETLVF